MGNQGKRQNRPKKEALDGFVGGKVRDDTRPPALKEKAAANKGKRQKRPKQRALDVFVGGVVSNGTRPPVSTADKANGEEEKATGLMKAEAIKTATGLQEDSQKTVQGECTKRADQGKRQKWQRKNGEWNTFVGGVADQGTRPPVLVKRLTPRPQSISSGKVKESPGKRQKRPKQRALDVFVGGAARNGTRPTDREKKLAANQGKRQKRRKQRALVVFVGGVVCKGTRPPVSIVVKVKRKHDAGESSGSETTIKTPRPGSWKKTGEQKARSKHPQANICSKVEARAKTAKRKRAAASKLRKSRRRGDGVNKSTITNMSYKGQDGDSMRYSNAGSKQVDKGNFNP